MDLSDGEGQHETSGTALAIVWLVTGSILVTLRPRNSVGWLLLLVGALQTLSLWGNAYGSYGVGIADPQWPAADWVALSTSMIYLPSLVLPGTVLLALYPDGHLPARWWRWPVGAVILGLTLLTVGSSLSSGAYDDIAPGPPPLALPTGWWVPFVGIAAFGVMLGGTVTIWGATAVRLARAGDPQRQQLAWLSVAVVGLYVSVFVGDGSFLWLLSLLLPIAVAVGVLRYGMLGVVLSRGLTYALLTAVVLVVYLGVSAMAGSVVDRSPATGVAAAALLVAGLGPARERVQRGVDRFVYGERRDPIRAVTTMGSRVAAADQEGLLDVVVASVCDAVRAPGAMVRDGDGQVMATHGTVTDVAAQLPLRVAGLEVGNLQVAPRAADARYSAADQRVLHALAPQVAVVVHALDLAEALQVQRDRVLAATGAERERLRRELHDGLGPSLSGTALGLQATSDALAGGRLDDAGHLIERIRAEVDITVADVRRIIDGLRPAGLEQEGLAVALRQRAASLGPAVDVSVIVGDLPELGPEVESATYRIAGEALANVARHAKAQRAQVELGSTDVALTLRITDDGSGFPAGATRGVGLASMRRRAEALGGTLNVDTGGAGTVVTAWLPLQVQ